nr:hypothetical protein [Bacteroidales bacterium]
MRKSLYLIISHEADFESCTHSVIGACNALDLAVAKLIEHIAETFEGNKEWWEDEEDEDTINEQYQEWIAENYLDEEHLAWSYTDDDCVEYLFKIVAAEIESGFPLQEAFAVLHTCIDGVDNRTELVGVYTSQEAADKALETYQSEAQCEEDEDCFIENVVTVERFTVE